MYKMDEFWFTFHSPFLTALVICLAVGIPCYIFYLCIRSYKKRQKFESAKTIVKFKAKDFIELSDVYDNANETNVNESDVNDNSDEDMTMAMETEDVVKSTFFLSHLQALERLQQSEMDSSSSSLSSY